MAFNTHKNVQSFTSVRVFFYVYANNMNCGTHFYFKSYEITSLCHTEETKIQKHQSKEYEVTKCSIEIAQQIYNTTITHKALFFCFFFCRKTTVLLFCFFGFIYIPFLLIFFCNFVINCQQLFLLLQFFVFFLQCLLSNAVDIAHRSCHLIWFNVT